MNLSRLYENYLRALNDEEFEEWLCVYIRETFGSDCNPQRVGRKGQSQNGVDVVARLSNGDLLGVQAKAYLATTLTPAEFGVELRKAHTFQPSLQQYIVCTLNRRDSKLQEHARKATINGQPRVAVLAREDLAEATERHPRLAADLIRRTDQNHQDALFQVFQPRLAPILATATSVQAHVTHDPTLRKIEAWIDAGKPRRALDDLRTHTDDLPRVTRLRLEMRALFALAEYDPILRIAQAERREPSPNAVLLAIGGHVAQLKGDIAAADGLLAEALSRAIDTERTDVVGAILRVRAQRPGCDFAGLVEFAVKELGSGEPVAVALADCAFQLGALDDAVAWYYCAHQNRPDWPVGVEANELGAQAWQLILQVQDGEPVRDRLCELAAQLEQMARKVKAADNPSLPAAVLRNLGHVCRVLEDYPRAAAAWDKALGLAPVDESLWLLRCALSATCAVPLPPERLIEQYATTPITRLVLAGACIRQGELARAEALIGMVEQVETLSDRDRALTMIERIRLECGGLDDKVTPSQIARMLELYEHGNHSVQIFVWLVFHFQAASREQHDRTREAINSLAAEVGLDGVRRLSLTEDLLRVGLDETALSWLTDIEQLALDPEQRIARVNAARVLLRLYVQSFRFDQARKLIGQLRARRPNDASVALEAASALDAAGDRPGAYALLSEVVAQGQRHTSVLLSWARLAVALGHRRDAHRVMRDLEVVPRSAREYSELLQARAFLGVHSQEQHLLAGGAEITPDTAGKVFGVGLIGRSRGIPRVEFGRVIHVQITHAGSIRLDERIVLSDGANLTLPAVKVFNVSEIPWAKELIGARQGETRILSSEPFRDHAATIIEVLEADRWSVHRARELVQSLPSSATGVQAVFGDSEALIESIRQQVQANQQILQGALEQATKHAASIALAAATLNTTPRALLWKSQGWRPAGHSGTTEDITADDNALASGARLVLDPVMVLLLVELGAEEVVASLPEKPVITSQAACLLFDWWYRYERHKPGMLGSFAVTSEGAVAVSEHDAARRRAVKAFWQRLHRFVCDRLDVLEPPAISDPDIQRLTNPLGPAIVSGMALAREREWIYLTEEPMLRGVAISMFHCRVTSLHRLLVRANERSWINSTRALKLLTTLMDGGWSWISFPTSMLQTALTLPEEQCWPTVATLLGRVHKADWAIAVRTLFALLVEIDRERHPRLSSTRLRAMIARTLPNGIPHEVRTRLSSDFSALHRGSKYRYSRQLIKRWAKH